MIKIERIRQAIVLRVNILSPNMNQGRIGKTRNPVPEPMNRALQADSVVSNTILHAYQKTILVGTPKTNADVMGLSAHHFHKNCAFS